MRLSLLTLPLALTLATAHAQDPACNCPPPKLLPFTGHILDATTGKPIANAQIHYLDDNPPISIKTNQPIRGFTSGTVSSGPDGSYQLPINIPLATYHIRVEAPGYYAVSINDSPAIAGDSPDPFPRPSHEIHLKPSHNLIAFGASQFPGAENIPYGNAVATAAISPAGDSLLVATRSPSSGLGLWLVSLSDGALRPIDLPASLHVPRTNISALGWDGKTLLFRASLPPTPSQPKTSLLAGATAPGFQITLLPAPDDQQVQITFGNPADGLDNFTTTEVSDCDLSKHPGPHCGQGAEIVARNTETGRQFTVFSASSGDLDYLHDPMLGGLIAFAENAPVPGLTRLEANSENQFVPGITLLNLSSRERSHIDIPGTWGRHLTFLAEHMVSQSNLWTMRLAYTVPGDCDPRATGRAQPGAPGGPAGFTPNNWSLCVVTLPMPPPPKPIPPRPSTRPKTTPHP